MQKLLFFGLVALLGSSCARSTKTGMVSGGQLGQDTLVLREICSYCEEAKKASTTCLCYSEVLRDSLRDIIGNRSNEFAVLVIENPSHIIFDIEIEKLTNLQSLEMFGNDSDALDTLPPGLLDLPALKQIKFEGVSLPEIERYRLEKKYSTIKLVFQ